MCNCGKKRSDYTQQPYTTATTNVSTTHAQNIVPVNFQYTGKTALTVTGNITGRRYRFNYPGDVQPIDSRDAASLMAVPVLKKIILNVS